MQWKFIKANKANKKAINKLKDKITNHIVKVMSSNFNTAQTVTDYLR